MQRLHRAADEQLVRGSQLRVRLDARDELAGAAQGDQRAAVLA